MVNVSDYPLSVDGVRLDTLAWGVEASRLRIGALRTGDVVLAGLDGVAPSLEDPREPSTLTLSMFVRGSTADGLVPAGRDGASLLRENLDELLHLFTRTDRLLDVRQVVDEAGTERSLACKVQDTLEPDVGPGSSARFTVSLTAPECAWRSLDAPVYFQGDIVSGTFYEVTTLTGSTAPVDDAVLFVLGPVTNPMITDAATGASIRLNKTLAPGEDWRIDNAAWESRNANGLTLNSLPTAGTDVAGITDTTGRYPRLLRLTPERTSAADPTRRVRISLTGTGITGGAGGTYMYVQARKAFR